MRSWITVPNGSSMLLVATADLAVRSVIDVSPTAVHALAEDGSALAYAEGAHVTVVGQLRSGVPRVEATFRAPAKVDALAMRGDVVFVGGFGEDDGSSVDRQAAPGGVQWLEDTPAPGEATRVVTRPRLGLFDRSSRAYAEIPLPPEAAQRGKRIDWLALAGDRLVVVDDVVYPKFNLLYDVQELRAPRHLRTRSFEWGLLRSFVKSVADDGVTLAILESHRHGAHVAIVRLDDLRFHGGVTTSPTAGGSSPRGGLERVDARGELATPLPVCAVAIAGATLYLAANDAGLGWVDLALLLTPRTYRFQGELVLDVSPWTLRAESIRSVPVPHGPTVGVIAVDATRAYAVVERDGQRHGVLTHLPRARTTDPSLR